MTYYFFLVNFWKVEAFDQRTCFIMSDSPDTSPWKIEVDQFQRPLNILESIPARIRASLRHLEIVDEQTALCGLK